MNKIFKVESSQLTKAIPLLVVIFFLITINTYAGKGKKGGMLWWRNPDVRSQLDLTNEQVDKIESIFQSYKEQIKSFHKDLSIKEEELREANKDPNTSRDKLRKLHDEVFNLRSQGRNIKVEMFLDIRETLTYKQRTELRKLKNKHRTNKPKKTIFFEENVCLTYIS